MQQVTTFMLYCLDKSATCLGNNEDMQESDSITLKIQDFKAVTEAKVISKF